MISQERNPLRNVEIGLVTKYRPMLGSVSVWPENHDLLDFDGDRDNNVIVGLYISVRLATVWVTL